MAPRGQLPSRTPSPGQRGLSLVEVLVALGILSFITLGIVSLLGISITQNNLAQHRSTATGLAEERLDLLTSMAFQPPAGFASYALPGEVVEAGPPRRLTADYGSIPGFPRFRRVVTLNYDTPAPSMLHVSCEVFWQDPRQGQKRHVLHAYLHPTLEQLP